MNKRVDKELLYRLWRAMNHNLKLSAGAHESLLKREGLRSSTPCYGYSSAVRSGPEAVSFDKMLSEVLSPGRIAGLTLC